MYTTFVDDALGWFLACISMTAWSLFTFLSVRLSVRHVVVLYLNYYTTGFTKMMPLLEGQKSLMICALAHIIKLFWPSNRGIILVKPVVLLHKSVNGGIKYSRVGSETIQDKPMVTTDH